MKQTIGQRIVLFLRNHNFTIRQLSKMINANEHTLGNKFRGVVKTDIDTVLAVLTSFPELSPDWLLFGTGTMLRGESEHQMPPAYEQRYLDIIQEKDRQISQLIDIIDNKL